MGQAGLASATQPHYEAPVNLGLASADLNPSDGLSSDKILKFYIYIANNINWLNKNLKMHFVLYLYKEIRSDIETWSKKISHTPF